MNTHSSTISPSATNWNAQPVKTVTSHTQSTQNVFSGSTGIPQMPFSSGGHAVTSTGHTMTGTGHNVTATRSVQDRIQSSGTPSSRMFSFVGPDEDLFVSSLATSVFARYKPGMPKERHLDFGNKIDALTFKTPLIIHTLVLPEGMSPDDPRLAQGTVTSERTYISDAIVLPEEPFTAHIDDTLLNWGEPADKFVEH